MSPTLAFIIHPQCVALSNQYSVQYKLFPAKRTDTLTLEMLQKETDFQYHWPARRLCSLSLLSPSSHLCLATYRVHYPQPKWTLCVWVCACMCLNLLVLTLRVFKMCLLRAHFPQVRKFITRARRYRQLNTRQSERFNLCVSLCVYAQPHE